MNENNSYEHTKAKDLAKINENYVCELCGSNKDVEGHHIDDVAFDGEAEEENILVVCKLCHDKIHNGEINIKTYDYRPTIL